ncbi:MAG: prepilin-type N-terminal cleavage/methylation domain-containing protein [Patescibacteria group bacterium]
MNKGFTLLETIIYVSLLSILMMGVFSSIITPAYDSMKRTAVTPENYQHLIENYHEE